MQVDFIIISAVVGIAAAARIWQMVCDYRRVLGRLRDLQRQRAEIELFDRLERCMQSDPVE